MKFSDIIELAKAGFTPKDIRDFLSQEINSDPPSSPDDKPAEKPPKQPEDKNPPEPEPGEIHKGSEEKVDNDEKYKELEKQVEDLKKALAEAQKDNTKKDVGDPKTEDPMSIFTKAAADFM